MSKTYADVRQIIASMNSLESDILDAVGKSVKKNIDDMDNEVQTTAPKAGDPTPKIHGGAKVVDYNIASYVFKEFENHNADAVIGISGEASDLAAFIEFGTGTDAANYVPSLDSDFQRQAMQFYKNGKGSLAHVPFFIPAWLRINDKIISDAQDNINKLEI